MSKSLGHIYTTTGFFDVKVITIDTTGCMDSLTVPKFFQINGPTVSFKASDTLSCKSLSIVFTDMTVPDGLNSLKNWSWNFGDGGTSTLPSPTHLYATQGIYTVSAKVTDASGCADSATKANYITVSTLKVDFSNPDSMSCPNSPNGVHFINKSTLGYLPTYQWSVSNVVFSSAFNPPPPTFTTVGLYPIKLVGKDIYGCTDSVTKIVKVDTPSATFILDDSVSKCPPLTVHFNFTGKYSDSLIWNFGEGTILTGKLTNPVKTYLYPSTPGVYTAILTAVSFGGCIAKDSAHIKVDGPSGTPTRTPSGGCDSATVFFSVIVSGGTPERFVWNFGDQSLLDSTVIPSISHFYTSPSNYLGVYIPSVTLVNDSACRVTYTIPPVTIVGMKALFNMDKPTACADNLIQFKDSTLTNGNITNYFWDFGDGNTLSGLNPTPSHAYVAGGIYTVKMVVTTQFGCTDSTTNQVKVVDNPQIDISGVVSQCVPAVLTFGGVELVPDTSVLTWQWDFNNGQISNIQNPLPQAYPKAGHYIIQLKGTNSTGCYDTASADLYIYPLPTVLAGADTTICLGQSVLLQGTGNSISYTWLPPSNSSLSCSNCQNTLATPSVTTTYFVQGTSALGCNAIDTVVVTVNQPVTVNVSPSDSVCIGQSVQIIASGAAIYNWTPASGLSNSKIANPMASPTTTTNYQVIGSDNKYCFFDTGYVNITVFNYPSLNVGPDVTINVGSSYQITGSGSSDIISMAWLPVKGLSCTDCLSPLATPINTTNYVLTAVNNGNCATSDSIRITVVCNDANFFVPNTFSPNGDGVNDVFYVRGKGLNIIPSLTIFNRWGQIVFQKRDFAANDPSAGWDGTINGQKAPIDVYVYTLEIICDNSSLIPFHGNITLIR